MKTRPNRCWTWTALLCVAVAWSGSSGDALCQEPGDAPQEAAEAAGEEPAEEAPDPFAVPDGSPEELLEYIQGLRNTRPEVSDYAGFVQFRDKMARATLEASEKILAAEPTDEQKVEAIRSKLMALSLLSQGGDAEASAALARLPEELKEAGLGELAREATASVFQSRLQNARQASDEEYRVLVDEIKTFVAEAAIGRREASLAMRAAQGAEMAGRSELAAAVYRDLGKLLVASDDEAIASAGVRMEGSARRMGLEGNKMLVKGVTLGGEAFDWAEYDGKVVLVDFWATWCGPCVAELPNIRQNYDLYHEHGFDVVAISLDSDRERLEAFVQEREIPWTILYDGDAGDDSMADYYGIFGIPTVILVGADGKVVSLSARGPALGRHLEELLGPVEKPEEEEPEDKG